jgi:hypothetical protein
MRQQAMRCTFWSLSILALAVLPGAGGAAPLLAVDVDPATPGVQSSIELAVGASFSVDIVISGVDAASSVSGFELDLDFASSVVVATSVSDGGFLLAPVLLVESDIAPPDVNFAEVTLGLGGATGSGVLARVAFQAVGLGTSALALNDVIVTHVVRPGVVEVVPLEGIANASVRVVGPGSSPVPEPTGALLFGAGMWVVAARLRRARRGRWL